MSWASWGQKGTQPLQAQSPAQQSSHSSSIHELSILGSEGDLNHYEPRALPSGQAIPAASSASGCPAYTSTPLRQGKRLLEAACSISGKQAISCLLPNGSWRPDEKSYFWGPVTMGKSVPGGVRISCSPLYPQALEWHRVHSWALSVCWRNSLLVNW